MSVKDHSRLLINEEPLQVLPSLAVVVGINEAILLQQTHYWLKIAEKGKDPRKLRECRWWTYNSYADWQRQMPWLKERTIRSLVTKLEDLGCLMSRRMNSKRRDQTKWYTIDYEKLDALLEDTEQEESTSEVSENDTLNLRSNVSENDTSRWQKMTPVQVAENDTCITESPEITTETSYLLSETDKEQGDNQKPSRKIEKLSQEEYGLMFQQIVGESKIGEVLKEFSRHLARQNSSGTMRNSRAYNDIGKPYLDLQQECSQEAIRYGLREAMRRDKDFRYAAACARNYSPPAARPGVAQSDQKHVDENGRYNGKYAHLFVNRHYEHQYADEVFEEDG